VRGEREEKEEINRYRLSRSERRVGQKSVILQELTQNP